MVTAYGLDQTQPGRIMINSSAHLLVFSTTAWMRGLCTTESLCWTTDRFYYGSGLDSKEDESGVSQVER